MSVANLWPENHPERPLAGWEVVRKLQEALGIAGPIAKITIEASCDDIVRVHVVRHLQARNQPGLLRTLGEGNFTKYVTEESVGHVETDVPDAETLKALIESAKTKKE